MSAENAREKTAAEGGSDGEGTGAVRWDDVGSFLQMLDRLVTVLRVYPKHHPVVDGVAERCVHRLDQFFDGTDRFEVSITPTEVVSPDETSLFSAEFSENDRYVWYEAHSDGLKGVRFQKGLTADELQRFMDVIEQVDGGSVQSDDDTITLLWEKQLEHIAYRSVDSFIDNETLEEFNNRSPLEVMDLVADAAIEPDGEEASELRNLFHAVGIEGLDWFTNQRVAETFHQEPTRLSEDDIFYALGVDRTVVSGLQEEWERGGELEVRFIEALLSVIRTAPESPEAERAGEMIFSMTMEMLEKEMYRETARVLGLLHSRGELFEGGKRNPLRELVTEISDPMRIEALLWRMQKAPEHREALQSLLPMLEPDLVQGQVITVLADEKKELSQPGLLVDLLLATTTAENSDGVAEESLLENSVYMKRLLANLRGRNGIEVWQPARRLLKAAVRSSDEDVQTAALEIEYIGWKEEGFARTTLVPLLKDRSERLRQLGIRRLKQYHPDILRDAIRELIFQGGFTDQSRGEIRYLLRQYVENNSAAMDDLLELLDTRGWLSDSARSLAIAAARHLVEARHPEGLQRVREMVSSLWVSPTLKTSLKQVLETFGPGEETDGPVADRGDERADR